VQEADFMDATSSSEFMIIRRCERVKHKNGDTMAGSGNGDVY